MPFTPLHAGPGLVIKGLCGSRFSLLSFLVAQVVIDLEPLYYMIMDQSPLHRMAHTLLGATGVAGIVVCMMALIGQVQRLRAITADDEEFSLAGICFGGLVGTWSHVMLDSMVHLDVRPFAPFNEAVLLYGVIEWEQVDLLCLLCAAVGLLLHARQRLIAAPRVTPRAPAN
jgi:membrane-bound metal-dependent hydrolase YbcI (DUF457 family)